MTYPNDLSPSPFPTASDMSLDMWTASEDITRDHSRIITGTDSAYVCKVFGHQHNDPERDANARRIDMVGDLYEALRMLADRAKQAGMDVSAAEELLTEFVAPKPFDEVR